VPVNRRWGINNRSTGLRIPAGDDDSTRIEHRVAGADANPYLLTAAVLAGIHHGLHRRLDPGAPVVGNPYRNAVTTLPITWPEAALKFEGSAFLREYFGEKFHHLFVTTRRGELQTFESHVSPLEYAWYARTC